MNYIGSKHSLLPFLQQVFNRVLDGDETVLCDIFAGTGAVGRHFKRRGMRVLSNDIQYYSYVLNRAYLGIDVEPRFDALRKSLNGQISRQQRLASGNADDILDYLHSLSPITGFLSLNYGPRGGRQFYTSENAEKADAIRTALEGWRGAAILNEDEYFYLLCSLIEALDSVANTASVYGAFLKRYKASALKALRLRPLALTDSATGCQVFNTDSNELIEVIESDVLYLDPPYNHRQYGANYHVLETLARYDQPAVSGTTGMRDYPRSRYCQRRQVREAFTHLVGKARTRHIFVSYNDEGLMTLDDIQAALALRGSPTVFTMAYNRYKADNGRDYKRSETLEYLHYVRVER